MHKKKKIPATCLHTYQDVLATVAKIKIGALELILIKRKTFGLDAFILKGPERLIRFSVAASNTAHS